MNTIRTLQVVNVRWYNATAWYGVELARLLDGAGQPTLVLGLEGTAPLLKAAQYGLETRALPLNTANPLRIPGLLCQMDRLIRQFRPDVINCHRGESFVFWPLLAQQYGCALVRTRGDQRPPRMNRINSWLHAHLADALVATNSVTARRFVNHLHVPEQQVHTVIGGVDRAQFRFDAEGRKRLRAEWNIADTSFVVGILGRFDPVKGQRELIQAVGALIHRGYDLRLILAGFPAVSAQHEIEDWLAEAGIAQQTIITGKCMDVAACISAFDLGVVASLGSESIARAALEIMACSVPLVSTHVGVMPDLLPDREDVLLPVFSSRDLAQRLEHSIARAVDQPQWLAGVRALGMRRIHSLGLPDFLEQSLAVYKKVLKNTLGH